MKNTVVIFAVGLVLLLSSCGEQETTAPTINSAIIEAFGTKIDPKNLPN